MPPSPEPRFRHLFELIGDPVVEFELVDGEPIVRTINPAFTETFGYEPDAILDAPLNEFIVPETADEESDRFDQRTADGKYNSGVVTRLTADGPRDFLYRGIPYERDGGVFGFAIYTDITERNRRKEKLRKQKQRFEEFAEIISHDIRNPLSVAKGRAELLDHDHADIILRNLERIDAIIDDVLTVAWTGQPIAETEPVCLSAVAPECWQSVTTPDATLTVETDDTIRADPGRLKQLFENLFRNSVEHALDAADETACLQITVGRCDGGFFVADDGTGIPPDEREDVFNRGYSTTTDGTGLGLSIVQSICDAHGWTVTVTDSAAGGARFEISGVAVES